MKKSSLEIIYNQEGKKTTETKQGYSFTATTSDGAPVELFVFKFSEGIWNVTEPVSNARIKLADTRAEAVKGASSIIGSVTLQFLQEAQQRALEELEKLSN